MLLSRPSRVLTVLALAACGWREAGGTEDDYPRNQTVYIGGFQWPQPSTFNPLATRPDWPLDPSNAQTLLYETLLVFNTETGEMQPLLAESFRVERERVEVLLQPAARFSDGSPVTPEDVKYTFDLARRYRSLRAATVWPFLEDVLIGDRQPTRGGAPDPVRAARGVTFALNPKRLNPLVVLDALQEIYILPRHVVEPMFAAVNDDINRFLEFKFDDRSIGTGPYTLHSVSAEKIATVRRDDYWGNDVFFGGRRAVPKYVVHPIYKSNDHYSVALQQGRLDAASSFIPRIWLKQRKGVRTWYDKVPYFSSSAMPVLWINVNNGALGDAHLRRAMAFAIQYDDIRELAVSGYSEPLVPGLIFPFGFEGKYYSREDAEKYGAAFYSPDRARQELAIGGYRPVWDAKGELVETLDRQGHRVPTIAIKSPTGWTDWESSVRIVVRSLRAVGIDARERFVDSGAYYSAMYTADFDLLMAPTSPPAPSSPWSRFDWVLTTSDFAPPGEKMYRNLGRFNDPKSPGHIRRFDELLGTIPTLTDNAELLAAYRELNILFMREQPILPLVYRPDQFYEFSNRVWRGFPTAADPFLPPQIPSARLGTRILWHLSLAEADSP
jgi:peptide/nickel transport system substrate-binding protein